MFIGVDLVVRQLMTLMMQLVEIQLNAFLVVSENKTLNYFASSRILLIGYMGYSLE